MRALFKGFKTVGKFITCTATFVMNVCWVATGIQAAMCLVDMAKSLNKTTSPV